MKFSRTGKLLLFLLLGVSLAFGLLTSRAPRLPVPAAVAEPGFSTEKEAAVLSPAIQSRARMLSDLKQQVTWYMSRHDDFQSDLSASKRMLLNKLPSAGSPETPTVQPQFALQEPVNSMNPVSQRVIVKLKPAFVQPSNSAARSSAAASDNDPFAMIQQQFNLAEIKKVLPDTSVQIPGGLPAPNRVAGALPEDFGLDRLYSIRLDPADRRTVREVIDFCAKVPGIEYAEPDYPLVAHVLPDDPLFPLQWHLNNIGQDYPASGSYNPPPGLDDADINAPEAWDVMTGSNEVIIAVIDTGVDYEHPDLAENMWVNQAELNGQADVDDDENGYVDDMYGYNFIDPSPDPKDDNGHGTHCAGIIAARGNNGIDITGVCWSAKIMALKFLNRNGSGSSLDSVQAIVYAVNNGARVISNSYGGPDPSQAVQDAIAYAVNRGVVFVASAGNEGTDVPLYPAAYENVLSVAATNSLDHRAVFSSYGDWVDLAAPGVDILSLRAEGTALGTVYNDATTILSGTSMACPVVAGSCGLVLGLNPTLTSDQVQPLLLGTLDPLAEMGIANSGRLNANRALAALYGQVRFGRAFYACSSGVDLWLSDLDLAGQGTAPVTVQTDAGDVEQLTLNEATPVMGYFTGIIQADGGQAIPDDGVLQFAHGQILTVTYQDSSDVSGQVQTLTHTATADCQGPNLSDLDIQAPGSVVTIRFTTDEPAKVAVHYGSSCGGLPLSQPGPEEYRTEHVIKLTDLLPGTAYNVEIQSEDTLGNVTVHDNAGACFTFTTTTVLGDLDVPADFPTIQAAVNRAWDGDTVRLADGIHTGPGNVNIRLEGKQLTIKSINGPAECVLDCDSGGRGFILNNDPNTVIEGLTIIRGYSKTNVNDHTRQYLEGGSGIYAFQSKLTVKNCIFRDNFARGYGGAIYMDGGNVQILDCIFTGGTAVAGGAVSVEGVFQRADVSFDRCTIFNNHTELYGGGIDFRNASVAISNSDVFDNTVVNDVLSSRGGGVYAGFDSDAVLFRCRITDNTADLGGGVSSVFSRTIQMIKCRIERNDALQGGGVFVSDCNAILSNTLLLDNAADVAGGLMQLQQVFARVENCTFARNAGAEIGGGLTSIYDSNAILTNSIVYSNTPESEQIYAHDDPSRLNRIDIAYSDVQGGPSGVYDPNSTILWHDGNIDADPLFAFPADVHLLPASPCIDRGTASVNVPQPTDLDGAPRTVDGNGDAVARIDMGPYEFDPVVPVIALSASLLEFQGTAGDAAGPMATLQLRNPGGAPLVWQITPQADWVHVSPSEGTSDDLITDILLQIDPSNLSGGDYTAQLLATAPGAVNTPQTIRLNLYLAGTLYVPSQYPTIQAAVDAARDGDTVLVADGIYTGQGNRDIHLDGKAVHLKSQNGPATCILDVQGSPDDPHRVFTFYNSQENNDSIIEGFTLIGGHAGLNFFKIFPPFDGGAIYASGSNPVFKDCFIKNNSAYDSGGAVTLVASQLSNDSTLFENCSIILNNAQGNIPTNSGGGGFWIADVVRFNNVLIAQNQCNGNGGGVWIVGANQKISNCTIVHNLSTFEGGGCYVLNSFRDPTSLTPHYFELRNSIVNENDSNVGTQLSFDYNGIGDGAPKAKIRYSSVPMNENDLHLYHGTELLWEGEVPDADPLFVDPAQGNYRLQPTSPLIERGSNGLTKFISQTDLDGNPRLADADYDGLPQVDIGAYEFVPAPFQGPLIEVSDWQFDFVAFQDESNPPPQFFNIRNSGTGLVQWQIPDTCPWLTVSPSQGTSSGDVSQVTLQPDITGLSRGLYTCHLAVDAPAAANHPRTFTVTLRVFDRGRFYVPEEFPTIQAAVNAAAENDQITIAPGTYEENLYLSKNITLSSQDPNNWDTVSKTIISGKGINPVVMFSGTEQTARLIGLTLTGGVSDSGGGIRGSGTRAAVDRCIIRGNTASGSGGGISAVLGPVTNCKIFSNTAASGGGIADCNDVVNCVITSNQATEGGGLYNIAGSIIHCTIADNSAVKGAGLSRCPGMIQNSILWANLPDGQYQSSQPSYSCVQSGPRGPGSIQTDPEFMASGAGDYRLAYGSLCIDAAGTDTALAVTTDIEGFLRPFDGNNDGTVLPDMGAYEMPLTDQVVIGLSQNEITFTSLDHAPRTLKIWNAGLPAVHYTISEPNCSWLTVSPASGTVFNTPQEITLSADPAAVPAGAYTCRLMITDPNAINSPRTVDVRLTVFQDLVRLTPAGPTIQHALSYVTDGGTILLSDGVYSGPGNRDINFLGRPATVKSAGGPGRCIIDLQGDPNTPVRGFLFTSSEGPDSVLQGLTIINAYTFQSGGAVACDGSSPAITDCVFENNRSEEDGGAVYARLGSPILARCVFESNAADRGGAVAVDQGSVSLSENVFLSNTAVREAGAVFANSGSVLAADCCFTQNTAADGGAMFCDNAAGQLAACTFTENAAVLEDWYHGGGAIFNNNGSDLTIENCRFIANTGGWDGGAIENWRSSPDIIQCEFTGNQALGNDGGAVFNILDSDPNILRCTFTSNHAKSWGGAMRNRQSSPRLENCLFVANDAIDNGGAIFNFLRSSPEITNCTFVQNTANGHEGGAMYSLTDCTASVVNSIFWGNEAPQIFDSEAETSIAYSTIDWPGMGNIAQDPLFSDPENGDFRLSRTSPCIDSAADIPLSADILGAVRPWDCPWAANTASGFDRGAFEFSAVPAALKVTPTAINLKSRGREPRAKVVFGSDIKEENIDKSGAVMVMTEQFAFAVEKCVFSVKKGLLSLEFPIDRGMLSEHVVAEGPITISVTVPLTDGRIVYAADTIRILHAP